MRIKVSLEIDVDLDVWAAEYHTNAAGALKLALSDLRDPETYGIKDLFGIASARAVMDLNAQP